MTIPLQHFFIGLGFLLLGTLIGILTASGHLHEQAATAHLHLLLAGWVCITIMGAMTQFVPVWSGVSLYSNRLPLVQLWCVSLGLLGFSVFLITQRLILLIPFGWLMAFGFWVFVYNIGSTLRSVSEYDVTERHFAIALGFFVILSILGLSLAIDLVHPLFRILPVSRSDVINTHATIAVFGAILTTVFGALYQLATMFTQTDLHGIDSHLRRIEEFGYPVGVIALAGGRLFESRSVAIVGGVAVGVATIGFSILLGRRLYETQVDWSPMLSRYAVLTVSMALWALITTPAWVHDPLSETVRFGAPGAVHLLTIGVVGFVVLGTLYHIIPFITWIHSYSDQLGLEPVPMIDDLYSDRIAMIDFWLFLSGGVLIFLSDLSLLRQPAVRIGGVLIAVGIILFTWNHLRLTREHSPHSLVTLCWPGGRLGSGS